MNAGTKIWHAIFATGKVIETLEDRIHINFSGRKIWFKADDPALLVIQKKSAQRGQKKNITLDPILWSRVLCLLSADTNFKMSVSVPPVSEQQVEDEMGEVDNLTIASDSKLAISYDVRYSSDEELIDLLAKMGVESKPFFGQENVSLAHGPRKEFYTALRNANLGGEIKCDTVQSVQELRQPA